MLRGWNYLLSAPAPASAPAVHCHSKLYCNSSTIQCTRKMFNWQFFLHPCILQTDCSKYLLKRWFWLLLRLQVSNNFGSTVSGFATLKFKHVFIWPESKEMKDTTSTPSPLTSNAKESLRDLNFTLKHFRLLLHAFSGKKLEHNCVKH